MGERGGEGCGLIGAQVGGRARIVVLCGGFRAEYTGSPLGNIEVQLENAVLGEEQLESPCDDVLLEFAER